MESPVNFLHQQYFDNTVQDYLIAGVIVFIGLLLLRLFRRSVLNKLRQWAHASTTQLDDMIVRGLEKFGLPLLSFAVIYAAIHYLHLSDRAGTVINVASSVVLTCFGVLFISTAIRVILQSYIRKQENAEVKLRQIDGLMIIFNIVIWTLGIVFTIDNLGYNVSAILAGVGIGGIAVALAAQNIVGDLFNYFVIFFDKPFEVGDAITVGDKNGTIEHIGIKTTRLRSLTGEQIIISNSDLTQSRVHNFKRLNNRRIPFSISVTFHTSSEQLKKIPGIIKGIIEASENTRFDRAHFARFTEYGLVYDVVYFVTVPDYVKYMDVQQNINLKIMEAFEKEDIRFLIREDRPGAWDNAES